TYRPGASLWAIARMRKRLRPELISSDLLVTVFSRSFASLPVFCSVAERSTRHGGSAMSSKHQNRLLVALCSMALGLLLPGAAAAQTAKDPGVRGGPPGAGDSIPGLSANQIEFFLTGRDDFAEAEETDEGLGPRFNLDGCGGCHSQPAIGG